MVTKEIINNAVKYSDAQSISTKVTLQDSKLNFEVKDDGAGFDLTAKRSGNGLKNIRYRIEELGGILQIESSPGKGSSFFYSIPLLRTT